MGHSIQPDIRGRPARSSARRSPASGVSYSVPIGAARPVWGRLSAAEGDVSPG